MSKLIEKGKVRLSNLFSKNDYDKVINVLTRRTEGLFTKTKGRHEEKFENYVNESQTHNYEANNDTSPNGNWVKNLSDTPITDSETKLLNNGLKFSITPKQIPKKEIISAIEVASSKLNDEDGRMLRARVATTLSNFKTLKCNVSKEEKGALRSLKQKIKV